MSDSFVGTPLAIPLSGLRVLTSLIEVRGGGELSRNSFLESEEVAPCFDRADRV
jgi:hypothetical protein